MSFPWRPAFCPTSGKLRLSTDSYILHLLRCFFPQTVLALRGSYVQSNGIGCGPQRRTRRWGTREFPCVSTLPLWFRANSGLLWPLLASSGGPLRLRAATAHAVGRDLRFDAPAVVSREFPCVSTLPPVVSREFPCVSTLPLWFRAISTLLPWFRANSLAFRRSRRGFARIPLRFDAPAVVGRDLRFDAPAVVFRRSRCGFARIPASSGLLWPLLASSGGSLRLRAATAHAVGRDLRFDAPVSKLPPWFRATSLAFRRSRCVGARPSFRRSRCGFARNPLRFDAPAAVSREFPCVSTLPLWFRANSGLFWPPLASSGPPHCLGSTPA